ncbi:protein FAR-RED ELONGATED HYPOCOTYL 1 [Ziziphus jujuba]|uniref:Protein FAR-RED ELONGATED HYPOCOTYL 1 n=1 Tax=Ziziphus jujuba TaxID=326968 RepID=A0A6P4BDA8_ZIZJJ|nr:protein FAR-RED ELONGATED HYPOCOTYL 1 [Ziziphus jujuba]
MDDDNKSPSEINSFRVVDVIRTIKKRKLQAEQLELPTAKHKCWQSSPSNESVSMSVENPDVQSLHSSIIGGKTEEHVVEDRSEHDSGKDSNSFFRDSDSPTSIYVEAKVEPEYVKTYLYDMPSTSSGTESCKDANYPLDSLTVVKASSGKEELAFSQHDDGIHLFQNHEEHLIEFSNHVDYINCEYEDIEQCTDKELGDLLYSNRLNPNTYVLSSGRWSVNQDTQSGARKPTIDQEFEQYFSMLML